MHMSHMLEKAACLKKICYFKSIPHNKSEVSALPPTKFGKDYKRKKGQIN